MWDKIAASAALVIGAFALLIVITVVLIIMEHKDNKNISVRLEAIRYQKTNRAA
ncbi:MAG: hypothetical protein WDA65_05930 [Christensenellales bacterium]